jgi:hypothetical protein
LSIQTNIKGINTHASPFQIQFMHIFHEFACFSQSRHIFSNLAT